MNSATEMFSVKFGTPESIKSREYDERHPELDLELEFRAAGNRAISKVSGKRYENVKIFFDILYIVISALICLVFLGRLQGVREGSIIAAVLVGSIIKVYNRIFDKVRSGK